ncbi:hypothetical protein CAP35_11645 [Chitinophagaceae bacterium IBVUCB1]|nr:hypothetical protein CAP35_11645 [Chitinophagaceae bacterium IBVUCB1]
MRRFTLISALLASSLATQAQTVADFESLTLPKADTFYVNYSSSGNDVGFNNGLAHFPCVYNSAWGGFWDKGFAYSNMTDSVKSGFSNQYAAKTAKGYNGSNNYLVANSASNYIQLTGAGKGSFVSGFYVTNSTYAYNSMRDGDAFAKKFGGTSGNDADWFKLVIRGYHNGTAKQDSIEVYLADFRFTDNTKDYILKTWQWVNLMPLGKVDSLDFKLSSSDVGGFGMNTPAYFCMDNFTTQENLFPFAPQATITGTTAVIKTDASIKGWAAQCKLERGWMDIADKAMGKVTLGADTSALGMADNNLLSLGDSGVAVLTFNNVLYNGAGADFVVFENGFANGANPEEAFLEYAFVEVSSDGINYTRFPAVSMIDTVQIPMAGTYANTRAIHNLAGKYVGNYGTPFDLDELAGTPGLDVNNITHIRLVDVVGSIGIHGQLDKNGRKINDPYPTQIPSGGFDLDAVGAMYLKWPTTVPTIASDMNLQAFPNPAKDMLSISFKQQPQGALFATITDMKGSVVKHGTISNNQVSVASLTAGVYYLVITDTNGNKWVERISKI